MRFFGRVGSDGCSRLTRVEKQLTSSRLEIAFHAERKRNAYCTQMPVALRHDEIIPPPLDDPFTIRATQPGTGALERTVRVEEGADSEERLSSSAPLDFGPPRT